MTEFHHGITAREAATGKIPLRNADTNTIAMLAFADDADKDAFPLNTPVLVTSINRALPKAGASGNLRKNLEIISQITSPTLVVIRIENPFSDGEFDQSQVIGTTEENGQRTGLQALLTVKSVLGLTPKIICISDAETIDVASALGAICKKLRAYAYITPRNENGAMLPTAEAVARFRKMLAFREIELIWPEWTSGNVFLGNTDFPENPDGGDRFVISCTPPEGQQQIILNKVRNTLPFLTFRNIPFDIYINGTLAASDVLMLDADAMDSIGLQVEDLTGNGREISINNKTDKRRAFELSPVEEPNFARDTDIELGHVVVEKYSFHFCLAPAVVEPEPENPGGEDRFIISCTPPEVQQRIVLNKVRDTLPSLTFNNVVFDIYTNGIPAASGVSLLDAAVMDLHGLKVEDLTGNGRKISITPKSDRHKAFELRPTFMPSFTDDTDIEEGHAVVENSSFHFCLAAAPLPAENWDIEYVQGGQTFREKTGSYINDSLKANMQLTSLTINSTVETVGSGAFEGCNLLTDLVLMDGIKTLRDQAFNRCSSLRSFSLPPSIKSIDHHIFNGCSSLEHAVIPDSVNYLGGWAFQNCTSLKSASVGNGIKLVEAQLFRGCSALKTVTLGNNVERIQIDSFYDCPVLESVTLLTAVPPAVFSGGMEDYAHLKFYVPADAVSAYQMAANWSEIAGSIFAMP